MLILALLIIGFSSLVFASPKPL